MYELHSFDNSQLMDLLDTHTSEYTKMITDNNMGDDYEKCKLTIKAIQTEIEIRKNNLNSFPGETNITKPPDFS